MSSRTKLTGATRKASALPVVFLCFASIAIGALCHIKGVHMLSGSTAQIMKTWNTAQLKRGLGLTKSWPGTDFFEKNIPGPFHFLLLLVTLFAEISRDWTGSGLLFLVASFISPILVFISTEALKDGQSLLITELFVILVASAGQAMMIGAAVPIFLIPVYAFVRWSEVKKPSTVHPLPSPPSWKLVIAGLCHTAAMATFFPTSLIPPSHEHWVLSNLIFQFFPLAWVPLLFISRSKTTVSTDGSASARQTPRLSASTTYQLLSYALAGLYYLSIYLGYPGFIAAYRNRLDWKNDGHELLFWDGIGSLSASYLVVLIDSWVDEAKVTGGASRTHSRRLIVEDVLIGIPGVLLFGPGWAMAKYFQRREILAEKARFNLKQE